MRSAFLSSSGVRPQRRRHRGWVLAGLLWLALSCVGALAQSVRWEPGDSSLGSVIQLIFEDCEPDGDPQLPVVPGVTFTPGGRSESSQFTMGTGGNRSTKTVTLSYLIQSRSSGTLQIPAFSVKTDKGVQRVAAFNAAAPKTENVASSRLTPERSRVWAGEVFGLNYEITAARRNNPQFNPTFEWNAAPLTAEEWSKPDLNADAQQIVVSFHTRAYARAPNTVKLEAATHLIQVQTGAVGFGLFSQARMEPVSVTSDQPVIDVRPLPAAPAGFSGAVGHFKFTSKVVPQQAAVGEPVTWTLELSGTGNWPDINGLPQREVSKDFTVVQPKAKRTPAEGKLFDATLSEDVVLVPTKAGQYSLPAVEFTFFNPQTGQYETARTAATTVTVTPPASAAFPGAPATSASTGAPASAANAGAASASTPVVAPKPPAGIPRDPLPGEAEAALPLSNGAWFSWILLPFAALLAFWLVLAGRRAAATDPGRAQREAHRRLAALLGRMSGANGATVADQLLAWQHDAAILWRLAQAAPSARSLSDPAWATLWDEADRALYGPNARLPADWIQRAQAALAAKAPPKFNPLRLFLPRNLLAFAATTAVLIATGLPPRAHAATAPAVTPDAAYRAGDFAAAETAWRAAANARPTDWIARHNLSLALAQQDHADEAAAQASAAFVQHPTDPSVRWHFEYTAQKAGFAPAPLLPLLKDGPLADLALQASPATWQRWLIAAAFVTAAGLAWLLASAYGGKPRRVRWTAAAVAIVGALGAVAAVAGYVAYGETADRRAVIAWHGGVLRSIPTEADSTQKTTTLAPGSVALADHTFLGWVRLTFPGGQTGWVRREEIVPLWQRP